MDKFKREFKCSVAAAGEPDALHVESGIYGSPRHMRSDVRGVRFEIVGSEAVVLSVSQARRLVEALNELIEDAARS